MNEAQMERKMSHLIAEIAPSAAMMADPVALVYLIENDQEIRNIRFYSESVLEDGCEIEMKMRMWYASRLEVPELSLAPYKLAKIQEQFSAPLKTPLTKAEYVKEYAARIDKTSLRDASWEADCFPSIGEYSQDSVFRDLLAARVLQLVRGQRPDFRADKQISLPWHLTAPEIAKEILAQI
jgi:hypothetical protein